ncbi:hypothetical protein [Opitutus sp. ER46]|uniref:hypothetical protein n=1 Tax=Opitutus sp. ER46 TaxID=2161864 RepID=UPI000D3245A8|nr:hypothetical protein [Opitutus sp. ER46]PTX96663.1 hypothetical protein DB354_08395 [Opitutus sp. ER46]
MEKPWKVIVAFLGVFIAGAVFGGFFSLGMGMRWMSILPAATPPAVVSGPNTAVTAPATPVAPSVKLPPPSAAASSLKNSMLQIPQTWQATQVMRRYAERLDLTLEQKDRVMPLIRRATDDYRRIQQNTFRETAIVLQRLQQDIAKELTPAQLEKLNRLEERQRETIQKMEQSQRDSRKAELPKKPGAKKSTPAETPPAPVESAPAASSPAVPTGTPSA